METKHTPGPWTILGADYAEGAHVSIVPPNAAQVASVKKFDNWQANARLIAAAPDLLAACIGALQSADEMGIECPGADDLRAAIAKATGEPA